MAPKSRDSSFDNDKFQARTQHVSRDPSPDLQANRWAETDFAAVGALFSDRRESEPRPNSLDLSEGEETSRHPSRIQWRTDLFSNADAAVAGNTRSPGGSPTTPTPTRHQLGPYIQQSDMGLLLEHRSRRGRRAHRRNTGTRNSVDAPEGQRRGSDTSNDDSNDDDDDERDRSTTPTPNPYSPESYTPSHHSQQTEEGHEEGQGPLSPNPFSAYFPYDPRQHQRTAAFEDANAHFPVDEKPRAE